MEDVVVAAKDVHNFPIHSHPSVEEIQPKMSCQEQRASV
jgi:hypothetical protein